MSLPKKLTASGIADSVSDVDEDYVDADARISLVQEVEHVTDWGESLNLEGEGTEETCTATSDSALYCPLVFCPSFLPS